MHVCTVCAAERSASRHHMLKHNEKMNLPMFTGREPNLLKRQARPYHEQAWTNQGHWVNIVKRKKINMNCTTQKLIPNGTEWTISNQLQK